MVRSGEILQIRHLGGQGRLSYWGIGSWVFLYLLRWLWKIEGNQSQVWRSFAGEHMQSFGTSVRRSSSDENYVVRCDELGSRMGSNVLRSSWVQRLRPAGLSVKAREIEGTRAGPSRASEEKLGSAFYGKGPSGALLKGPGAVSREDKTESEEIDKESRLAIYPELLPNVESILGEPSKVQQRPRTSASEIKADLVTETQVIAGFGPFQIRARSLIAPKPSIGNPTLTPVPADDWKQYYHAAKKEHTTEHRPITAHSGISRWEIHSRTTNEDGDIREFRGGFPGPAPMAPYLYPNWENKAVVNDTGKKLSHLHSGPYCRTNNYANDNERLSKLQWHTARLHPGETRENVGLHKETVPLTRDRVVSGTGMEMDATQSANAVPIRIGNKIESDGFAKCPPPKTLTSSFTRFGGAKQISGIENCTHRSFLDQKSVWKQQSETFPNVKANRLEVGNFRGKLCSEPSSLTPLLAPRRFGIAEEIGRFDSMEMPPVYTSHGKQNDEITPSDSSSSTASLPNEVYAQLCNRMNNEKKSSECHVHAATGTALICQHNAGYYRPTRELNYLEPESNSSHYSSCPWPDQEDILTRADKKDVRFSKKPEIARHGSSDVKGKASNIQKPLREQCHKRKCIGSSKGAASHYNSRDDGIDLTFQEKYAGAFSHCPDSQAIFRPVAPEIQPVTVLVPSKEAPPKGSARDDHEQGIFKKVETISAMVQTALPGKESPSNNVIYCPGKNKLDSQKFHSLKSRKQLSETGPTTERVIIPSTGREAEIDYDRHVRLKTSSVDGHTSISGKRARCTLEENQVIRQTNTTIANNTTTMSEASTDKDCRPRMWLQRWIHSSGKTDLRESNSGENLSSNLVINDGPLSRSSIREWSGDNRKVDRLQWPKGRRKGSIGHFSGYSSQPSRERQFNSELKGNQFRKDLFTPSASAMAIMGTRTKEMYAARPFPVWASTQRADADAKAAELGKDIKTPDDLELKPKNKAFEQRTAEQKDVCI